jgi:hypothetical protein
MILWQTLNLPRVLVVNFPTIRVVNSPTVLVVNSPIVLVVNILTVLLVFLPSSYCYRTQQMQGIILYMRQSNSRQSGK